MGDGAERRSVSPDDAIDVAVIGGGLAGLATATHLARAGRRVICIERHGIPPVAVGESLDFSAAALLGELGIPAGSLLEADGGYGKNALEITEPDDRHTSLWPPRWFARPPIWCSMFALHADRAVLDRRVAQLAAREGVELVTGRVARVESHRGALKAIVCRDGRRIEARWFVDASGHVGQVLGRRMGLARVELGPKKVSLWTRFRTPPRGEATAFYIEAPGADYLEWVWEIPLSRHEVSVGCVVAPRKEAGSRSGGQDLRTRFEQRLQAFPRLRALPARQPDYELRTTAFTPYCHRAPIGRNWALVGDAAALPDPLTSNGVTAALRHAELAAMTIDRALDRGSTTRRQRWVYRHNVNGMARRLNAGIERLVYERPVRRLVGLRAAVILYAFLGITTNSLHSKLRPTTTLRSVGFWAPFTLGRCWVGTWHRAASLLGRRRRERPSTSGGDADRELAAASPTAARGR